MRTPTRSGTGLGCAAAPLQFSHGEFCSPVLAWVSCIVHLFFQWRMRGLVLRMLMRGVRCSLQVNYQQLPINQPKCPYHNNMHDGAMQMTARDEEVRPDTMRLSAECCD